MLTADPLIAQRQPPEGTLEAWRDPVRAGADLFMVLVGGSDDGMEPIIRNGDLIVVAQFVKVLVTASGERLPILA